MSFVLLRDGAFFILSFRKERKRTMYKQVPTSLNFVDREKAVEKFWEDNDIFKKSMEHRKEGETYTFYDGPPTANGKPHIGHVETRTIKDMIPRYRTMKGYMVPRKAGWDTHGLPVELEVEKMLGLDGKEQIEEYGLAPFIDKCKESVWKYKGMWEDFSRTVGFWADMDNPYVTYDDNFIESEWWALKTIWDKGLLYKGFKIVPYCPRCGTPLSSHEVAQGYKAVKERSAIVRFKVKGEDAYFLAWTTTPWTLPSNVALCVNPEETYLKVKAADGYTYYIAKALADKVLGSLAEEGKAAYEVLETYVGKDLEYKEYEPLYKCAGDAAEKQKKKAHFVTCDDYVTMTDGTGIVHIAPAFGEDDSRIGRNYELPFVQFVDGKGDLTAETPYAGKFVKDADPLVLKDLDAEGKLFDAPKFEHDYPFCWRCDTPLIYYARESWFIKMTAVKDDLVRNNKTINWIPASIGEGRFGNWLENIQDWGVSRNRYWGTPLNIWECECGHQHSIGSREELYKMSGNEKAKTVEFHRPYIDEITITCPECGRQMMRMINPVHPDMPVVRCPRRGCPNCSSYLPIVEERVIQGLSVWMKGYELEWSSAAASSSVSSVGVREKALASAEAELRKLQQQLERTHDFLEQGVYDTDTFLSRSRMLSDKIAVAKDSVARCSRELTEEKLRETSRRDIIPKVRNLLDVYPLLETAEEKNALLKEVLEKVVYQKLNEKRKKSPDGFTIEIYPRIPKSEK